MTIATIVDADGEIVAVINGNAPTIEANTPAGCAAVDGSAPTSDAYRAGDAWVQRPARPSDAHTWDATEKRWRDVRTLAEVKAAAWAAIKNAATSKTAEPLVVGGRRFDADALSLDALSHAVQAADIAAEAGQAPAVDWTLADNTVVTLTRDQLRAVLEAVNARNTAVRAQATALRAQITDATTRAAVAAVVWPAG